MKFVRPELAEPSEHSEAVQRDFAQRQKSVAEAFRLHRERMRLLLPPPLQQLQDQYIHDAWIESLHIDPVQKTLELCLIVCDTPGCVHLTLRYQDIQLTEAEISLLCLIAHEASSEIYWGEVDIQEAEGRPPVYIHRILWNTSIFTWPFHTIGKAHVNSILTPEIELRFGDFTMTAAPHTEAITVPPVRSITVVRDLEKIEG